MRFHGRLEIFVSRPVEAEISGKPLETRGKLFLTTIVVTYSVECCAVSMHIISSSPQPCEVGQTNSPHFIDKETKLRRESGLFLSTFPVSGRAEIPDPLTPTHTTKKLF